MNVADAAQRVTNTHLSNGKTSLRVSIYNTVGRIHVVCRYRTAC